MHSDFIVPKIQPDELLAGYRGRIAAWNGCETPRAVAQGMSARYPIAARWTCKTLQFVEAAALANNIPFMALIREHTTYILRAESGRSDLEAFDQACVVSSQASMAMYSNTKRIWGCQACMREDLRSLNFSYWRRSHQVPGRVLCPEHETPLVAIGETVLLPGGPAHSETFVAATREQATHQDQISPGSAFAVALLDEMIKAFHRPAQQTSAEAIREGLKARGLDPSDSADRSRLQEELTDHFCTAWLECASGKLGAKPATIGRKIERVLNARVSCPAVDLAMVAKLAFTDIAQALSALGLQPRKPNQLPACV